MLLGLTANYKPPPLFFPSRLIRVVFAHSGWRAPWRPCRVRWTVSRLGWRSCGPWRSWGCTERRRSGARRSTRSPASRSSALLPGCRLRHTPPFLFALFLSQQVTRNVVLRKRTRQTLSHIRLLEPCSNQSFSFQYDAVACRSNYSIQVRWSFSW